MKPRVLIVSTYYHPVLGGVETHARQLVNHLHDAGFGVEVVTKRVGRDDPAHVVIDGVPVHRVGPAGERSASGKWVALPAIFGAIRALASRFDVILCVDYRGIGVGAIAAGRLRGKPVILQGETAGVLAGAGKDSKSGLPPESAATQLLKAPVRAIYRLSDHIVCIGRDLEREALGAGVPRERVHYIPPGVDVERFHPATPDERDKLRRELSWPADRPVVLFVGRLSVEKGAMDLLEAWRALDRPDALLALVGPDMTGHPWDAGVAGRAFVAEHQLGDRVRFEGPAADTSRYYRAADIYVQPSHFEAFGSSAIEALASGLPAVSSGVGGLGDFLVDGGNALLHDVRSPRSIAAAISRLLDDVPLRQRLGRAGRQTAAEHFEIQKLFDRYAQLIESTAVPR